MSTKNAAPRKQGAKNEDHLAASRWWLKPALYAVGLIVAILVIFSLLPGDEETAQRLADNAAAVEAVQAANEAVRALSSALEATPEVAGQLKKLLESTHKITEGEIVRRLEEVKRLLKGNAFEEFRQALARVGKNPYHKMLLIFAAAGHCDDSGKALLLLMAEGGTGDVSWCVSALLAMQWCPSLKDDAEIKRIAAEKGCDQLPIWPG